MRPFAVPVKVLESKKRRGSSRKNEKEILAFIREKGLAERSDIMPKYCSHSDPILRELVRDGKIFTFSLQKGGNSTSPFSAKELFDGFAMNRYYYIDEKKAADIITKRLDLSPNMTHDEKFSTTQYLRRCLPSKLFRLVYGAYGNTYSIHWPKQPDTVKGRALSQPRFSDEQLIAVLKTIGHPATSGEISDALGLQNPELGKAYVRHAMYWLIQKGKAKKTMAKTGSAKLLYALQQSTP